MWRAPDQELLSLQSNLLLQQQQQGTRSSHDSLFQRRHLGPQSTDCTRIQASEQHHDLPHGLQQALLSEAAQGPTADLPNMQLDLDNVTLATAVGFGSESVLAHFHRSLGDQARQSPSELNAVLAASLGVRVLYQLPSILAPRVHRRSQFPLRRRAQKILPTLLYEVMACPSQAICYLKVLW